MSILNACIGLWIEDCNRTDQVKQNQNLDYLIHLIAILNL